MGRSFKIWLKTGNENKSGNVSINVTLRCVRVTTVAMKMQYVLHIMSVCL